MSALAVLLLLLAATNDNKKPPAPYTAFESVTTDGRTSRSTIYFDGARTKSISDDGKIGYYRDESLKTTWQWNPAYGCIHVTDTATGVKPDVHEEALGSETIAGHPTRKVRKTEKWTDDKGKVNTYSSIIWYATDLDDFVMGSKSADGKYERHVDKLTMGAPNAKLLAFPSPPCDASEVQMIATAAPKAAGSYRTIRFDQGACELMVPLPISMSIPSDFTIRSVRPAGCFWGADDDLKRLLANPSEANFESIQRGVFWVRPSTDTEYSASARKFVSEIGPQEEWGAAFRAVGAQDVIVTPKPVGAYPATTVTLKSHGQRVYMLYLSPPNVETIAMIISYRGAGKGSAADDIVWKTFIDSLAEVKR
jgi:hypothetical protein